MKTPVDSPSVAEKHSVVSSSIPARQTTAYLKKLFVQVGFNIDTKRGQNFLVDLNLLELLERSAGITATDVVLEVGTGTGALTERLAHAAGHVVTIEIDRRLAQLARDRLLAGSTLPSHWLPSDALPGNALPGGSCNLDRVTLLEGDALASKHRMAPQLVAAVEAAMAAAPTGRFLLVANLPYCVATPVISNLLALPRPFDSATVTVQREMAERLTSPAGSHAYNALSVWIGAQCRSEIVRILPPSVFWPRPKVDSAIVRLDLEPARRATIENLGRFHDFVRDVFCHRRKLLRGVLVRIAGGKQNLKARDLVESVYQSLGLTASVRAEEIPPPFFVQLEREFYRHVSQL
ncbi:MAG: ribosomal RNA small subunit methyltransferase A [Planctomycetota bacterium]|jgi:16S rRNA (adenine1518-N6/adenine1519-N6)-dimethyltransferase|nr:MAG: ribosomal RNA small subunit methyltransferase A [Planctomycetota bacterium]